MTAPRAVGVRTPYPTVPGAVRDWVDLTLGSPVVEHHDQVDRITSWLVGLGAQLAWRSHTATDLNLPALKAFRRTESARFLAAAARRLDLGA